MFLPGGESLDLFPFMGMSLAQADNSLPVSSPFRPQGDSISDLLFVYTIRGHTSTISFK